MPYPRAENRGWVNTLCETELPPSTPFPSRRLGAGASPRDPANVNLTPQMEPAPDRPPAEQPRLTRAGSRAVGCRVTHADAERLAELARRRGVPPGAFLRRLLLDALDTAAAPTPAPT